MVLERGTVYGLPVYQQRRVDYAPIDAVHARDLFLREAIVETLLHRDRHEPPPYEPREPTTARMLAHDRKQVAAVEELEHKTRRPDVLVDAELLVAFFDAKRAARHRERDRVRGVVSRRREGRARGCCTSIATS